MKRSLILLAISMQYIHAHQPHMVESNTVAIENPEVSQAFYAKDPAQYTIDSAEAFSLYVQILRPKIHELDKDISVEITKNGPLVATLDGNTADWTVFHEPFSNDDYYQGPSVKLAAQGKYTIEVHGSGKYVLVVGEKERWPVSVIAKTFYTLPKLKLYFEKSPILALWNLSGAFLVGLLATLATTGYVGSKLVKKVIHQLHSH